MNQTEINRETLIEAQQGAAAALEAGVRLAKRAAALRRGEEDPGRPNGAALGVLLGDPAAFWAGAAAVESYGDADTVAPLMLANRVAGARVSVGDMDYIRDSLVGQAGWLGVLAVKLAARAEGQGKVEDHIPLLKLALAAQRQAAQTLASAAALNRLADAEAVTVDRGD